MATFASTTNPTPFAIFDDHTGFPGEADNMVTFVKRKMGDDVLSVELTKKQIWGNFEESCLEYGSILNQYQAKSQLVSFMGYTTGSLSGAEDKLPRENLEFLSRLAEPYAMEAGVGGSYTSYSGSITLKNGQQDYNLNTELKDVNGNVLFDMHLNASSSDGTTLDKKTKLKIDEVFHFNPQAAYRFFDTTSAINYLNNEFSFESFTPETIFYVLPVFEDILRAGQLDLSNRIRRSNYSYKITGNNLRVFPTPTGETSDKKLWIRFRYAPDPLNLGDTTDNTMFGVSNMNTLPFGNINYARINSIGRQWIRQFTLALSREQLGLIRSKFGSIPVPGAEVTLNGDNLISQGREDKKDLITALKEMLDTMTYDKLIETQAARAENIQKQLKYVPMKNGMAIFRA